MHLIRRRFFLQIVFSLLAAILVGQKTPTTDTELSLYKNEHSYVDESPDALARTLHDLRGLDVATSQEPLASILDKTGTKTQELLSSLPNLNSNEYVDVDQISRDPNQSLPGHRPVSTEASEGLAVVPAFTPVQMFNYMVLVHDTSGGRVLEEFRTDPKGNPVVEGPKSPSSVGFASMWAVFASANQSESKFHYLGEQKIDGHDTFVVAFAQIPGRVRHPGTIRTPDGLGNIPMLSQGIAWIDKSNFKILRLHTDLLTAQPEIDLKKLTSTIQLGSVRIQKLSMELWLPVEVKTELEMGGLLIRELHRYSKFRLYKAESRIVTGF
jgi:hypothetical protein